MWYHVMEFSFPLSHFSSLVLEPELLLPGVPFQINFLTRQPWYQAALWAKTKSDKGEVFLLIGF